MVLQICRVWLTGFACKPVCFAARWRSVIQPERLVVVREENEGRLGRVCYHASAARHVCVIVDFRRQVCYACDSHSICVDVIIGCCLTVDLLVQSGVPRYA